MRSEWVKGQITQIGAHVLLSLDFPLPDTQTASIFYQILQIAMEAHQQRIVNGFPNDLDGLFELVEEVFGETAAQAGGGFQVVGIHKLSPDERTKRYDQSVAADDGRDGRNVGQTDRNRPQSDDPLG